MEYTIWRTYHKDSLISEYNLVESEHVKLFGTHLKYDKPNINYAGKVLCEMCTMYYVWKNNLYSDFIGFDHYQRQFNINNINTINDNQCLVKYKLDFSIDNGQITNVKQHYYIMHSKDIYDKMQNILVNKYSKLSNIYKIANETNLLYSNCLFIMSWSNFNKLCKFLFDILFELDKLYNANLDFNKYEEIFGDAHQARNLAFLSERLISYWIENNFDSKDIFVSND